MERYVPKIKIILIGLVATTALMLIIAVDSKISGFPTNKFVLQKTEIKENFEKIRHSIVVLYESTGIDRKFQLELLTSVQMAFDDWDKEQVNYIDLGQSNTSLANVGHWLMTSQTKIILSLLQTDNLNKLIQSYENLNPFQSLTIVSPRLITKTNQVQDNSILGGHYVKILCLQMDSMSLAMALLNRVEKTQVTNLIPILDKGSASQLQMLKDFEFVAGNRNSFVELNPPIFLSQNLEENRILLNSFNFMEQKKTGILMMTTQQARLFITELVNVQNQTELQFFSLNFLENDELTLEKTENLQLYSLIFAGGQDWDNPTRKRMLKRFQVKSKPRVLYSVLAYDSAVVALSLQSNDPSIQQNGLSGQIRFNTKGYRNAGLYFGISYLTNQKAEYLLQSSSLHQNWFLDDLTTLHHPNEPHGSKVEIKDYALATAAILSKDDLINYVGSDCHNFNLNIMTLDPFNVQVQKFAYTQKTLPNHLLIPGQYGFGFNLKCQVEPINTQSISKLQFSCRPLEGFNSPLQCFHSTFSPKREKRFSQWHYPHYSTSQRRIDYGAQYNSIDNNLYVRDEDAYNSLNFDPPTIAPPIHSYYQPIQETVATVNHYYGYKEVTAVPEYFIPESSTRGATMTSMKPPMGIRQRVKQEMPNVGVCLGSAVGCALCIITFTQQAIPLGPIPSSCTGSCFLGLVTNCSRFTLLSFGS